MWPTFQDIYENSYRPFADGEMEIEEMYERAEKPIRIFMYRQMRGDADNTVVYDHAEPAAAE